MIQLQKGLPEAHRAAAARLYWEAFGGKLGRVMGPDQRAHEFLIRVIRADHCLVALQSGALIGLCGFKTPLSSFAGGGMADMTAVYGRFGGWWRSMVLRMLSQDIDNERFLIDGIAVTRAARGQGVGTALVQAVCAEGRARGYGAVRLDVVDSNWRARALYQRLGFAATATEKLGLLRHVFGFASSTTMVRPLDQD